MLQLACAAGDQLQHGGEAPGHAAAPPPSGRGGAGPAAGVGRGRGAAQHAALQPPHHARHQPRPRRRAAAARARAADADLAGQRGGVPRLARQPAQ